MDALPPWVQPYTPNTHINTLLCAYVGYTHTDSLIVWISATSKSSFNVLAEMFQKNQELKIAKNLPTAH